MLSPSFLPSPYLLLCLSSSFPPLSTYLPSTFFLIPLPSFFSVALSCSSVCSLHHCKGMHADVEHLNTIAHALSHPLKVGKAPEAPGSLFPLVTNSKWTGWQAQTPQIYTSESNTQIIHSLHCKKWECKRLGEGYRGKMKAGLRETALNASYFGVNLRTYDQTWDLSVCLDFEPCNEEWA